MRSTNIEILPPPAGWQSKPYSDLFVPENNSVQLLTGRPYDKNVGPAELYNRFGSLDAAIIADDAPASCQGLFVMDVKQKTGIDLGWRMRSREATVAPDVHPGGNLRSIKVPDSKIIYGEGTMQSGDVISIMRASSIGKGAPQNLKEAHMVSVEGIDEQGRTRVLHADYNGVSYITTLEYLLKLSRYGGIYGARRPRVV